MFDEEVRFEHKRNAPENNTLEAILSFGGITGVIAGAIGGYLSARHGLDFNKFWSFAIGGSTGGVLVLAGVMHIEVAVNRYLDNRHKRMEIELDEKAKKEGVESTGFNYRGNILECVIRKDFEEGHIFYMKTNDGMVSEPTFSYQPKKKEALRFRFRTPAIEIKETTQAELSNMIDVCSKMINKDPEPDENKAKMAEPDPEKRYLRRIADVLIAYNERVDKDHQFKLKVVVEGRQMHTVLEYDGENFRSNLPIFSNCASELMKSAHEFYTSDPEFVRRKTLK